jgi:hypothetical protein
MSTLVILATLVIAGRVANVRTRPPVWHQARAKRKALRLERLAWEAQVRRSQPYRSRVDTYNQTGMTAWGGIGGGGIDCGGGGGDGC